MRDRIRALAPRAPYKRTIKKPTEIIYPESDGKPLAETDTHVDAILAFKDLVRRYLRDRADAYVAANNFIYFTEGNVKDRFSPDVYVVFGVEKKQRDSYFLWKEKQPPAAVFEFTSRKTKKEDATTKRDRCEKLGVKEYFMCDPKSEYLKPPLQGFRLVDGRYQPIPVSSDGSVHSIELRANLRLENKLLAMYGDENQERILSAGELAQAEAERAHQESQRAHQEALRANAAEAENARLRAELERLRNQRSST